MKCKKRNRTCKQTRDYANRRVVLKETALNFGSFHRTRRIILSHSPYKVGKSQTGKNLRERPGRKPVFFFRGKESATVLIFLPPEVSVECSFTCKERTVGCVVEKKMIHCWLSDSLVTEHVKREAKGEIPPATWVTGHRQCSHLGGAEGVLSKNQMWPPTPYFGG
jgi:hypothetical protein